MRHNHIINNNKISVIPIIKGQSNEVRLQNVSKKELRKRKHCNNKNKRNLNLINCIFKVSCVKNAYLLELGNNCKDIIVSYKI